MPPRRADAVNDILRGVQEPGGFGYDNGLALNQPSAGKTGTIQRQHGGVVHGLHPDPGDGRDDRRRQRRRHLGHPQRPDVGGHRHRRRFGSTVAGPMWGDAMHVIQQWLPTTTSPRPAARTSPACSPRSRTPAA
jgi:membrane carboxypeptidase/penicillin-binding protein